MYSQVAGMIFAGNSVFHSNNRTIKIIISEFGEYYNSLLSLMI